MADIHTLDCVPRDVAGAPRYAADHVIRHYRPLGLAALLRDLGADPSTPELEIVGGIGRLVLRADGSELWEPVVRNQPPAIPAPRPAPFEVQASRRATCAACQAHRDGRCTAASCGCAGEAKPEVLSSRCPLGRW